MAKVPRQNPWLGLLLVGLVGISGCGRGLDPMRLHRDAGPDGDGAAGCPGLSPTPVRVVRHAEGDWTAVLPAAAAHTPLTINNSKPLQAASAVDLAGVGGDMAGFVVSVPSVKGSIRAEADRVMATIAAEAASEFSIITTRFPGVEGTSPDGFPLVSDAVLELVQSVTPGANDPLRVDWVRNLLFPVLLGGDLARFPNLPRPAGEQGSSFVVVASAVLRVSERRLVVSGGVVTRTNYDSRFSKARIRAHDMANGSAVGRYNARPAPRCQAVTATAPAKVDLLWVIDEQSNTPRMAEARAGLHSGASAMWTEARALGLDFRMAAMGMGQVTSGGKALPAALCNPVTYSKDPGRFYGPNDTSGGVSPDLQACLLFPRGNRDPGKGSHGLVGSREAIAALLPRQDTSPFRLRKGARLVVIFVSDSPAEILKTAFAGQVPLPPFSSGQTSTIQTTIKPFSDYLAGKENQNNSKYLPTGSAPSDLAESLSYALVSDPGRSCLTTSRGTGYIELTATLEGTVHHICYSTDATEELLVHLIRDIAGRSRRMVLGRAAASASLNCGLLPRHGDLSRSMRQGFDLETGTRSLLFYGSAGIFPSGTTQIQASYIGW